MASAAKCEIEYSGSGRGLLPSGRDSGFRKHRNRVALGELEIAKLLTGIAAGDRAAFTVLYCGLRTCLLRDAERLLARDTHAAEDVVDDAFVDIWRKAGAFSGQGSATGWVRRIVRNKAVDTVRKQARLVCTDHAEFATRRADQSSCPEAICMLADTQQRIAAQIARLSADHQAVIRRFYVEELSVEEIAQALGIPEGTVKSRLFHARQLLLRALDKNAGIVSA